MHHLELAGLQQDQGLPLQLECWGSVHDQAAARGDETPLQDRRHAGRPTRDPNHRTLNLISWGSASHLFECDTLAVSRLARRRLSGVQCWPASLCSRRRVSYPGAAWHPYGVRRQACCQQAAPSKSNLTWSRTLREGISNRAKARRQLAGLSTTKSSHPPRGTRPHRSEATSAPVVIISNQPSVTRSPAYEKWDWCPRLAESRNPLRQWGAGEIPAVHCFAEIRLGYPDGRRPFAGR